MYNEYTHYTETTAGSLTERATAFGVPSEAVDGQDVRAVYETAQRLVARARRGEGPAFMLCNTYRFYGHHVGDIQRTYYRSKEEEEHWKSQRDPIRLLANWLLEQRLADEESLVRIDQKVQAEVEAGEQFALNAPFPNPDEVDQDVYA